LGYANSVNGVCSGTPPDIGFYYAPTLVSSNFYYGYHSAEYTDGTANTNYNEYFNIINSTSAIAYLNGNKITSGSAIITSSSNSNSSFWSRRDYTGSISVDYFRVYGNITEIGYQIFISNTTFSSIQTSQENNNYVNLTMLIDGLDQNKTVINNTVVNITSYTNVSGVTIYLLSNYPYQANGSSITPYTVQPMMFASETSTYNFTVYCLNTLNYLCNQNATHSVQVYFNPTTTTTPNITTTTFSQGQTGNIVFNKADFNNGYCLDNNTLALNTTDYYFLNGNTTSIQTMQTKYCVNGCDLNNGRCIPSSLEQFLYLVLGIVALLVIAVLVIWLVRRLVK
jgi:hypothetical protein